MKNKVVTLLLLAKFFCTLTGAFAQDMSNPQGDQISPPESPSHLRSFVNHGWVYLHWKSSLGATSYIVERSAFSGGPYSTIFPVLAMPQTKMMYYIDKSVVYNTTYYYVVAAINTAGTSPTTEEISVTPLPPPETPSSLTAESGEAQVNLSWSPSEGARSYTIFRHNSGSHFSPGFSVPAGVTNYTDRSVTNGITYYYRVAALGAGGSSPVSDQISIIPGQEGIQTSAPAQQPPSDQISPPEAPLHLHAWVVRHGWVYLRWEASAGATSYMVERSTVNGGPYSMTFPVSGGFTTTYIDKTGIDDTTYYYNVLALNAAGTGPATRDIKVHLPIPPPITPLFLTAAAGDGEVKLYWASSLGAESYVIYRDTASGFHFSISLKATSVPGGSTTTYTDKSVNNGTTYYYHVVAFGIGGMSPFSAQAAVTPTAINQEVPPAVQPIQVVTNNTVITAPTANIPGHLTQQAPFSSDSNSSFRGNKSSFKMSTSSVGAGFVLFPTLFAMLFGLISTVGFFLIFPIAIIYAGCCIPLYLLAKKSGTPNVWMAWVPVVHWYLMCKIGRKPDWWSVLLLAPAVIAIIGHIPGWLLFLACIASIIIFVLIWMGIAQACNKPAWLGILMILPLANFILPWCLALTD